MGLNSRLTAQLTETRDRVNRLVVDRGGVFRRSDLNSWGIDEHVLYAMLRRGWWLRLHRGVYVDAHVFERADPGPRHLLLCAASIAALDEPAYAFASTAAIAHTLPVQSGLLDEVQLLRPLSRDCRALRRRITGRDHLPPATIHTHHIAADQVTLVGGIATVDRAIAAVSAAAMSDPHWAVATMDAAAWQRPELIAQLEQATQQFPQLRGIGTVRRALPLVRAGAQTPLESFSRLRLVEAGLEEPRLQVALHDDAGLIGYADMLWPALGVVGEADGLVKYASTQSLVDEKRREDRIRACGYAVVRWTWAEIMANPRAVAGLIRQASRWSARRVG